MPSKRVLYVEDNFQNRRLVKKILNAKGYEVLEASDGLQGIAMAEMERPDLILMDINMPGLDGMEATARLKGNPDLKVIPVIALTANAMRGDRERIMAAGCDEYLQKPINNAQLVETIERFLNTANGTGTTLPAAPPAEIASQSAPSSMPNDQEQKAAPEIDKPGESGVVAPVAPIAEVASQPALSSVKNDQDQKAVPEIASQPSE